MGLWDKLRKRETPLVRASGTPRQKTYSAQSGFVYQYLFQGWRRSDPGAYEYVFAVLRARRETISLSILLADDVLRAWEQAEDRSLSSSERYGLAKMSLLDVLDREENPDQLPGLFRPSVAHISSYSNILDL